MIERQARLGKLLGYGTRLWYSHPDRRTIHQFQHLRLDPQPPNLATATKKFTAAENPPEF